MAMRRVSVFVVAGLALAAGARPAPAQDSVQVATQFWPELDVFARLSREARLFFLVAPVKEVEDGQFGDITDLQIGGFIEVGLLPFSHRRAARARYDNAHRMKYLRLRTGMEYLSPPGDRKT